MLSIKVFPEPFAFLLVISDIPLCLIMTMIKLFADFPGEIFKLLRQMIICELQSFQKYPRKSGYCNFKFNPDLNRNDFLVHIIIGYLSGDISYVAMNLE